MSLDGPERNKMMAAAPVKKEFHFAGGGIWRNATILAETAEEAEKLWHETKQLINLAFGGIEIIAAPTEQSTAPDQPKDEING
jgi:hypothetical protein